MSTPLIKLTPPSKTTLLPSHQPEIGTRSRDASFSSYLDGVEENMVLKVENKSASKDRVSLGKSESGDKELDVFDAEKYFKEADPAPNKVHVPNHHPRKDDPVLEIFAIKEPHPFTPTTTRTSAGSHSSLNSRTALLHNVPGNQRRQQQQQQPNKKPNKKSFLAAIGCKCSCADWNSVETDERFVKKSLALDQDPVKTIVPDRNLTSPPVFNLKMKNQAEDATTKRTKPLQVFGSQEPGKNGKMCSFAVMSWDAIAPGVSEEMKIPSISSEMRGGDDGSGSDASSDLFEIESLTRGGPHANPFLSMQTSDGCKSPACYAPSEASVEWSVVTASAADFSMLSDTEELMRPKKNTFKEIPRLRKPGLLSGCMSQKALRVGGGGNNVEPGFGGGERNLRTESFTTRFQDESELAGFGLKNRQRSSLDARVFSGQRSGNAAHLLYA